MAPEPSERCRVIAPQALEVLRQSLADLLATHCAAKARTALNLGPEGEAELFVLLTKKRGPIEAAHRRIAVGRSPGWLLFSATQNGTAIECPPDRPEPCPGTIAFDLEAEIRELEGGGELSADEEREKTRASVLAFLKRSRVQPKRVSRRRRRILSGADSEQHQPNRNAAPIIADTTEDTGIDQATTEKKCNKKKVPSPQ